MCLRINSVIDCFMATLVKPNKGHSFMNAEMYEMATRLTYSLSVMVHNCLNVLDQWTKVAGKHIVCGQLTVRILHYGCINSLSALASY